MQRPPSGVTIGLPTDPYVLIAAAPDAAWADATIAALQKISATCLRIETTDRVVSMIRDRVPDLLIISLDLPGALALCGDLKAQFPTAAIPLIAQGGAEDEPLMRQRAVEVGCDHWVGREPSIDEVRLRALHLLQTRGLFRSLFDSHDQLRMRRDWVRYLVHDLRSPLSALQANIDFINDTLASSDDEVGLALQESAFLIRWVSSMMQDLLDVDRIRRGEFVLRRARVDLMRVCLQCEAEVRLLARRRGLRITVDGEGTDAYADLSLTERVVSNLVGNAIRYARKAIRIEVAETATRALVRVTNDGPGIDDKFKERIFVPFVQLHDGATGGAGLGLAFCRLVADAHGGKLDLVNAAAGQVCFELELPLPQE